MGSHARRPVPRQAARVPLAATAWRADGRPSEPTTALITIIVSTPCLGRANRLACHFRHHYQLASKFPPDDLLKLQSSRFIM
jgi:hypothetical protein